MLFPLINPKGRQAMRKTRRRAAAVVELAVVLPVFVLIVLGTIEACSMIFLQQSLKIAAYEGARTSIVPKSNFGNVEFAAKRILDGRKVKSYSVAIIPSNFQSQPYGTFIRVRVQASCDANSLFASMFYRGKTMVADVEMMKEH